MVVNPPRSAYAEYYYKDATFDTATLPTRERLGIEDIEYLNQLVESHRRVVLVQYNTGRGQAVDYLAACHDTVVSTPRERITLYQFDGQNGCPSPEEFMG